MYVHVHVRKYFIGTLIKNPNNENFSLYLFSLIEVWTYPKLALPTDFLCDWKSPIELGARRIKLILFSFVKVCLEELHKLKKEIGISFNLSLLVAPNRNKQRKKIHGNWRETLDSELEDRMFQMVTLHQYWLVQPHFPKYNPHFTKDKDGDSPYPLEVPWPIVIIRLQSPLTPLPVSPSFYPGETPSLVKPHVFPEPSPGPLVSL